MKPVERVDDYPAFQRQRNFTKSPTLSKIRLHVRKTFLAKPVAGDLARRPHRLARRRSALRQDHYRPKVTTTSSARRAHLPISSKREISKSKSATQPASQLDKTSCALRTPHPGFPLMPLDLTWNWRSPTISIDGGRLESEKADFTRGLVLHSRGQRRASCLGRTRPCGRRSQTERGQVPY